MAKAINSIFVSVEVDEEKLRQLNRAVDRSREAIRAVSESADALRTALFDLRDEPLVCNETEAGEYHDENTLNKVRNLLSQFTFQAKGANTEFDPDALITIMQNEGILFRERK